MYQSSGATIWRLAIPALSNTPDKRSNKAFLPPNASRARALASDCSTTCGGTVVASERRLHWSIECEPSDWFQFTNAEPAEGSNKRLARPGASGPARSRSAGDQPGRLLAVRPIRAPEAGDIIL